MIKYETASKFYFSQLYGGYQTAMLFVYIVYEISWFGHTDSMLISVQYISLQGICSLSSMSGKPCFPRVQTHYSELDHLNKFFLSSIIYYTVHVYTYLHLSITLEKNQMIILIYFMVVNIKQEQTEP